VNVIRIIELLVYAFGVYAYGFILLGMLRGPERDTCVPSRQVERAPSRAIIVIGIGIMVTSFVWFCVSVWHVLVRLIPDYWTWAPDFTRMFIVFLFPPMIAQLTYLETQHKSGKLTHPLWRLIVGAFWLVGPATSVFTLVGFLGLTPLSGRFFGIFSGISIAAMFALVAVYSLLATAKGRVAGESRDERASRRSTSLLFAFVIAIGLAGIAVGVFNDMLIVLVRSIGSSLPLAFLFVAFYHEDRFRFFDLFIKRGLSMLFTIVLLVAFFGTVFPLLEALGLTWSAPWVYAVSLLPVVLVLPWIYARLSTWVDRAWLGRRYSIVEAVKRFLSGLQSATNEPELVRRAERGLSEIFQAPSSIRLELSGAPSLDFDCVLDRPVRSEGRDVGAILMGRRSNHAPYYSEDATLLGSLADVFSYMLENVRLQERERELSLQASRSELKALRAQINPHFLFNALNTIAGLIHKDPLRADATVEQLADVFRYTLRGSEKEWARLEDEIDFVRAYLDVEQARFGKRLQVEVEVEDGVATARVPTMLVQTLVENAVKHGVARVRGEARIEVRAEARDGRLGVVVADNGPGFPGATERSSDGLRVGEGFGLKSVRRRLAGHFDDRASLEIERDDAAGRTVVTIEMPLDRDARGPAAEVRR
jgi:two-component sensor histidine kinase